MDEVDAVITKRTNDAPQTRSIVVSSNVNHHAFLLFLMTVMVVVLAVWVGYDANDVSGAGSILTVTRTDDVTDGVCDADCSLRDAITLANASDTVVMPSGTYTLTLGTLVITKDNLTIKGAGDKVTIVQAAAQAGSATTMVFRNFADNITIQGITIRHGKASGNVGGILNEGGDMLLASTTVTQNTGRGVYNTGSANLTIINSTISNNTASSGGGIYDISSGTLTIATSTISGNTASSNGGGIYYTGNGNATINNTTIKNNKSNGGVGGGILYSGTNSNGSLTITNSTISGNTAGSEGGGIYHSGPPPINLTNVTVSGNLGSRGGGIMSSGGAITLTNVTITLNRRSNSGGAGIDKNTASLSSVSNSIIAANINQDCDGSTWTSGGHNVIGTNVNCSFAKSTGDLVGTGIAALDPRLGPLQDNGGPTFTHALLPGSLAIDSGNDSLAPATDQRGIARPQGNASDIGAYEFVPTAAQPGPHPNAPVEVRPATTTAYVNDTWKLEIWTNAPATTSISGVELYLDFDPTILTVIDSDTATSGIQIQPDTTFLNSTLVNTVDNSQGQISFSAGKLGSPFATGTFKLATVTFKATKPTNANSPTEVKFAFQGARTSKVDFGGASVSGIHKNAQVTILQVTLKGKVVLQGGSRPDSGWAVPMTVKLFTPGANPLTGTPVRTYSVTTQIGATDSTTGKPKDATFSIVGVPPGTFDISVVSPHTLTSVVKNVVGVSGVVDVDFGTLYEADANDDGKINISDFGILASTFGKSSGQSGFDQRADFDRDGDVDISDFGLLAVNFTRLSPINVP